MRKYLIFIPAIVILVGSWAVASEQWTELEQEVIVEKIQQWRAAQSTVNSAEFNINIETESPHSLKDLYEKINTIELESSAEKFIFLGNRRASWKEVRSTPYLKPSITRQVVPGFNMPAQNSPQEQPSVSTKIFDGTSVVTKRSDLVQEYTIESFQKAAPGSLVPWVPRILHWTIHDPSDSKELLELNSGRILTTMTDSQIENVKCSEEQTSGWLRFEIPETQFIPVSSKLVVSPREGWLVIRSESVGLSNRLIRRVTCSEPQALTPLFSVPRKIKREVFYPELEGTAGIADITTHIVANITRVNELKDEDFKQDLTPGAMVLDMRTEPQFSEYGQAPVVMRAVTEDGTIEDQQRPTVQTAGKLWKLTLLAGLICLVPFLAYVWKLSRNSKGD